MHAGVGDRSALVVVELDSDAQVLRPALAAGHRVVGSAPAWRAELFVIQRMQADEHVVLVLTERQLMVVGTLDQPVHADDVGHALIGQEGQHALNVVEANYLFALVR